MIKNIAEIPKTRYSINNLKEDQKYQNGFFICDTESNFGHIHQGFSSVVISEINILIFCNMRDILSEKRRIDGKRKF